jgi:transposase
MMRNKPRDADVYGVDIKNIFHVVGVDADGTPIQRLRCRRETLIQFFQRAALAVVGMEACPGSQWLARKIPSFGHTVKIVPAQFVKPYLKSNKNDTLDAEAIAEAITRPTMRFVEVKAVEQIDTQALHRARDQMLMHRTRLISQMRAFGLVPRQYSTGGKPTLLGISKRGNGYVRRLLIHGARSCVMHLDRSWTRLGAWIDRLETRMHANKVVVALANKIARIAWVVLNRPGTLYERIDPAFG